MRSAMKQKQDASAEQRWRAVRNRDKAFDDSFVYAVLTTGVYCRPSCAARTPRFENVRFFASNADAEKAGFRPCKRCRPTEAPLGERRAEAITRACRLIEEFGERVGPCSDRE